jgi:hypothetical protein
MNVMLCFRKFTKQLGRTCKQVLPCSVDCVKDVAKNLTRYVDTGSAPFQGGRARFFMEI